MPGSLVAEVPAGPIRSYTYLPFSKQKYIQRDYSLPKLGPVAGSVHAGRINGWEPAVAGDEKCREFHRDRCQ